MGQFSQYIEIDKCTQQILVKLNTFICQKYEYFFNINFKNVYINLSLWI